MKKTVCSVGYLAFVAIVLCACFSQKDGIERLWFFTHSNGNLTDRDTVLTPASFLSLKNDGSYTCDFGKFDYGNWKLVDKKIHLNNYQNQASILNVEYLAKNEMRVLIGDFAPASFESQPAFFKSPIDNPFLAENNLWRIPATQKESDSEIRGRLINHFRFWELYFAWALHNELGSVDVRSTPTLIKIYGNGFALKPFDQLPPAWRSYFFNEEDCRRANEMVAQVFKSSDIA